MMFKPAGPFSGQKYIFLWDYPNRTGSLVHNQRLVFKQTKYPMLQKGIKHKRSFVSNLNPNSESAYYLGQKKKTTNSEISLQQLSDRLCCLVHRWKVAISIGYFTSRLELTNEGPCIRWLEIFF